MIPLLAVAEAVAAVRRGAVVALPTDTVYGLGCDPLAAAAVEQVYAVKGRPAHLELSILAAAEEDLLPWVEMSATARRLAAAFWPGPLSLVVTAVAPRARWAVPRSGSTLSVRVPDHDVLRALLAQTGPLATTSANRHGDPPCLTAAEVAARFDGEVAGVVEGGPAGGLASTIIDCTEVPPRVLRPGPLTVERLRPYLGG